MTSLRDEHSALLGKIVHIVNPELPGVEWYGRAIGIAHQPSIIIETAGSPSRLTLPLAWAKLAPEQVAHVIATAIAEASEEDPADAHGIVDGDGDVTVVSRHIGRRAAGERRSWIQDMGTALGFNEEAHAAETAKVTPSTLGSRQVISLDQLDVNDMQAEPPQPERAAGPRNPNHRHHFADNECTCGVTLESLRYARPTPGIASQDYRDGAAYGAALLARRLQRLNGWGVDVRNYTLPDTLAETIARDMGGAIPDREDLD